MILVEEFAGVEITEDYADQIEVVGDLIRYIDDRGAGLISGRLEFYRRRRDWGQPSARR